MNALRKAAKSIGDQIKRATEEHPQITLVPSSDDAAEKHRKATDSTCGATSWQSGEVVACGLKAGHGGDHDAGGRSWRPRSGDDA